MTKKSKHRTSAEIAALVHQQTVTGSARCGVFISRGRPRLSKNPEEVTCSKCRMINTRTPPPRFDY